LIILLNIILFAFVLINLSATIIFIELDLILFILFNLLLFIYYLYYLNLIIT